MKRLDDARLYLVTGGTRPDLDEFLDAVLEAGVDILQLREKDMEAREQLALAERFRKACDRYGALFVMNDRVDLAVAAGADGVHLGQGDMPPRIAREMLGEERIIGRSTHAPAEFAAAQDEPVDYVCAGPVYATPTKPGRPATGLDYVSYASKTARKPWFAIGGIDTETVGPVVAAGARGIVVVRAITDAADAAAAVRALRSALSA